MVPGATPAPQRPAAAFAPADLLQAAAFPHPVMKLEVRETHLSWLILTGSFVYKVKKSLDLGFVDQSTLAQRRRLCEEELRLNRRLAAQLYLEVVPITRLGSETRVAGSGAIVEYAVRMRQFDSDQELSALLEQGAVSEAELAQLGERIAQFHAHAPRAAPSIECPHTSQLREAVLGTLARLCSHLDEAQRPPQLAALIDWTRGYLTQQLTALREREIAGFIRECHGDLHARNVVRWEGRLLPFDCLEFDPALRWIDVMNDIAFMVMDLQAHGRPDLTFAFLDAYLQSTGDYAGVRHLAFYAIYRALVRAMVDSLSAAQDHGRRPQFEDRVRMRVGTAAAFLERTAPRLIIMHGLSGSGKSWLSERLARTLGAVRIRSDVERKRLLASMADSARESGYRQGAYRPEINQRTYARLLEGAQGCLEGAVTTIIDAAFLQSADRQRFGDMARACGSPYLIVSCAAHRELLAQRIEKRRATGTDPSQADLAVLEHQMRDANPLSAAEQSCAIVVDTAQPDADVKAHAAILQWRERLSG